MTPSGPASFAFPHSTREVVVGPGCLDRLVPLAERHGCRAAALVLDAVFLGTALEGRLRDLLARATGARPGDVALHAAPRREPGLADVEDCRAALAAADPDLVVVVGGGSAMDAAKVARMGLSNPGDLAALAGPLGPGGGKGRMAPHRSLFVAVPTTAGTGSEVSESAVVGAAPGATYKTIFRSPEMTPAVALLDAELAATAPPAVTAASGYDAVTHAMEAFTSRMANPMTDPLARSALALLARALPASHAEPGDLAARQDCLVASAQAAMAFNAANLGLAHAISGAMGALRGTPHGLANALALPFTMAYNAPALGAKGEEVARLLGDGAAATAAGALSRLRHALGLDVGLDEHVPPDGASLDALAEAASRSGQVRMNPRPAGVPEIRAILEAMRRPTGGGEPVVPLA